MLKKVDETERYEMTDDNTAAENAQTKPALSKEAANVVRIARSVGQAIFMVLIIAGSVMVMNRIIDSKPPTKSRPSFKSAYTVDLFTASAADNQPTFVSYGQVAAARTVELRSLVSGEIVAVNAKLRAGETIAKGETLVEIDSFEYKGALAEAQSNLLEAKSRITENEARIQLENSKLESLQEQLAFAQADLDRITRLRQRGQSTEQQREARQLVVSQRRQASALAQDTIKVEQARLAQLQASLQRLEWKVEQAQRNLDSTKLVAPFTAIVRSAAADVGRLVSANDVVVSLYEEGTLETRFTLTDEQYGRLQTGQDGLLGRVVDVTWTVGGKSYVWPATIDRLGAEIASSRGGVEVYAQVGDADNAVALRPGAFVEVTVPDVTFSDSYRVPVTAIYGSDTVYVAVDGKLEERKVDVAAYEGEDAIIATGVNEGDQILTTRITEVSAGLAVRTEEEANAPQPPREEGAPSADGGPPTGRPTREEIAKLLDDNKMSREQFQAMPQDERRKLIREWRQAKAKPTSTSGS
ncbi:efflux RND transporter periplasmic adaptor subunit [Pseudahrensia aquimaris]|uniref:Efflux RND transporter periplasmic adaptor subunit n=1 Tax=Pseudahrensia aquimaris TaxID=744461 RepID=A0ABW3FF08_9HYPH